MAVERIATPFTLPSQGLFYEGLPGGEVELYPIRVREEKVLSGMAQESFSKAINTLLRSCLKTDFDPSKMILEDRFYLLLVLRVLSYGELYRFPIKCGSCSVKFQYKLDLNALETKMANPEWAEPFATTLPVSGDKVEYRLLRATDEEEISKLIRSSYTSLGTPPEGDQAYVYRLAFQVVSVNGKPLGLQEKLLWLDDLIGRDSAKLQSEMDSKSFGVDSTVETKCPACGNEIVMAMPWSMEFFRPREV